ncbi:Glutathione-regulated potassium-efflux system protein KefC [Hydrogenovibrio crunogenus]|uniref:Glutathione-regulated potassium-efflux system protein KefC n=1 Tax=Hydrogenovibrio crunogenus TaxID=39765 RepID=A0A4P7P064_9GAMM|nr:monovalent cation:proton antiporter-2 (CPA2) family protein [Hydrogenovibrio crunogenus]QBZ83388.1 Glutathione-regulated potassium-efflux system protein KefC [Hydrogenovibrio crunogenus]
MFDHILLNIVFLLVITVGLVSISRRFHLPPILNYILVGIIVGPFGFGLIESEKSISFLAEFGIVFLLFSIGLEFSLTQMMSMRKMVFGYGGLQVLLTGAFVYFSCQMFGLDIETSIVVASAFALSSTAIVIKQLTEQSEIQTRHGRAAVGVLIFQDLMAIPLLILIPALGTASGDSLSSELGLAFLKGGIVVVVMLFAGRYLLRPLFHEVASSKSQELFTLTVLTVVLSAAAFTEEMDISMTLGAFLAGMMLGETEYRHQIEADIRPFQDILLGLFFITVGMMISPAVLQSDFFIIIAITLGIMLIKGIVIFGILKTFKKPEGVSIRTAVSLAQVGEFGLVLITLALSYELLSDELGQILLTSAVISMMITPLLVKFNGRIANRLCRQSYQNNFSEMENVIKEDTKFLSEHVVLLGFGRVGQTTAKFLEQAHVPFVALDMDIKRVHEAQQSGEPVYFGDSAKHSIIKATNLSKAKVAIITFHNYHAAIKTLKTLKDVAPELPILVRTQDDSHINEFMAAGATEVVPDTFESSIMLASHLLLMIGQPPSQVLRQTRAARKGRYSLLNGMYPGESDHTPFDNAQIGQVIQPIRINDSAFAVGKRLEELPFSELSINIKSVKRGSVRGDDPDVRTRIRAEDVLIVQGLPENIDKFEYYLNTGK